MPALVQRSRVRLRHQQADQPDGRFGITEASSRVLPFRRTARRSVAVSSSTAGAVRMNSANSSTALLEGEQMRCEWGDGGSRHRPPFPQIGDDLVDQPDRLGGIVQHHLGDDAAVATRKLLAQPCLDDLDESEVGLIAVHDTGARIDVCLDGIRLDQALAKSVDGGAGDFVDPSRRRGEIDLIGIRQTVRERDPQLCGDSARSKIADEVSARGSVVRLPQVR